MRIDGATVTVAFDWNGTLVDDARRAWYATDQVLLARGLDTLGPVGFGRRFRLPLNDFFADLGIPLTEVAATTSQWNRVLFGLPPMEMTGASLVLDALRGSGYRLGVISAADGSGIESDLGQLGWAGIFDLVVGDAAPKRTPIESLVRSSREPVVYVGDTEYDIAEARAAGAIAVGLTCGYRPRSAIVDACPDRVIDELVQLLPIVAAVGSGGAPG